MVNAAVAAAGKSDLLTDWVIAQGKRVMGVSTPADVFRAWREYRTDDVSPLVTQDVLLMAGAKDHYMPLHMLPDQLMTLIASHSITARVFTEAESAQNHCQIGRRATGMTDSISRAARMLRGRPAVILCGFCVYCRTPSTARLNRAFTPSARLMKDDNYTSLSR